MGTHEIVMLKHFKTIKYYVDMLLLIMYIFPHKAERLTGSALTKFGKPHSNLQISYDWFVLSKIISTHATDSQASQLLLEPAQGLCTAASTHFPKYIYNTCMYISNVLLLHSVSAQSSCSRRFLWLLHLQCTQPLHPTTCPSLSLLFHFTS